MSHSASISQGFMPFSLHTCQILNKSQNRRLHKHQKCTSTDGNRDLKGVGWKRTKNYIQVRQRLANLHPIHDQSKVRQTNKRSTCRAALLGCGLGQTGCENLSGALARPITHTYSRVMGQVWSSCAGTARQQFQAKPGHTTMHAVILCAMLGTYFPNDSGTMERP